MNRNILLFVCVGVAAGLIAVRLHRPPANSLVASEAAVAPADSLPVIPTDAPAPEVQTVSSPSDPNSNPNSVPTDAPAVDAAVAAVEADAAPDKYELLRQLSARAAENPEATLQATLRLPEGDERNEALTAVCFGLAQADPADAVKLAQDLHLDEQPGAVMEDLVQQWAASDVSSSLAWAASQPAGAPRDEYTTRIAFILSQTNPSDAATLVMNQIPPGPKQDEAIMTVLHQWANQNLAAAATWANGVATGPLQQRVINELNGVLDYQQARP